MYIMTGISFGTAVELGNFLRQQGFETSSEGYTKMDEVDGSQVDVSYTLTKGRCWLSIKVPA